MKGQHQGSLMEQLHALHALAIREGFYDAADWLIGCFDRMEKERKKR